MLPLIFLLAVARHSLPGTRLVIESVCAASSIGQRRASGIRPIVGDCDARSCRSGALPREVTLSAWVRTSLLLRTRRQERVGSYASDACLGRTPGALADDALAPCSPERSESRELVRRRLSLSGSGVSSGQRRRRVVREQRRFGSPRVSAAAPFRPEQHWSRSCSVGCWAPRRDTASGCSMAT
jgi:hypothetical protein